MSTAELFTSWTDLRSRALARDGHRCVVGTIFGLDCHDTLDVHHVIPIVEGGAALDIHNVVTVCHRHHPIVEGMRRRLAGEVDVGACPHNHPYPEGAEECRRRRARMVASRRAA